MIDTETMSTKPAERLEVVQLSDLRPHPKNPRLVMREDVVDSIVAQLEELGVFSEMHAPIVRPMDGYYETISGHHRIEAARRAKLDTIPCWVKEMSDYEAFMLLVLSNAQGELASLELGIHALDAVGRGEHGRGKVGGLSEYARVLGKSRSYLMELVAAAEVFSTVMASMENGVSSRQRRRSIRLTKSRFHPNGSRSSYHVK